jgi:tellurite methyltransferase
VEFEKTLPRGSSIADIGAGNGRNALYLASQGHYVEAVDVNSIDLMRCKNFARSLGLTGLNTVIGNVQHLPQESEQFDAVICCVVLQMVAPKEYAMAATQSLRRITKPGGKNLLVYYIATPADQLKRPDITLFSAGELERLYSAAGWEDISYKQNVDDPKLLYSEGAKRPSVTAKGILSATKPKRR